MGWNTSLTEAKSGYIHLYNKFENKSYLSILFLSSLTSKILAFISLYMSIVENKDIELYHSLFRGRSDSYAYRREKEGKS